jgi:hypothetical protein
MYQKFEVRDFRCFRELTITDLERVNLIAGMNNVGKTALLEALFLHSGAYNPSLILKLDAFRGIGTVQVEFGRWVESLWASLFNQFDTSKTIELAGENSQTGRRSLRLRALHHSDLAKVAQFIQYNPDESQGVFSSSEIAQAIELEYEEGGQQGSFYMIIDAKGIRPAPIPPAPPFPAFFQGARTHIPLQEEAERFGKLEIIGRQDILVEALRLIEPRLRRLAVIVVAGRPMLHGDLGTERLMPLPVMGGGMVCLASLVLHIGNAPNGVVFVDEIENGLHHSVLQKVWGVIGEAAREFNTQVFATTHSLECTRAAHRAFTESGVYDFRLQRLERRGEAIHAVTYDQESLEAAIETGLEVR